MGAAELFGLAGKVALVTGGNAGLGLGFATGIAKCGGDVVVWGRRTDENEAAAEQLRALGAPRVMARRVDVTVEGEVVDGMAAAVEAMGRVDCVVANAGVAGSVPFHEMSMGAYRALLEVNQHGAFTTMREAVRHMRDRARAGDPGGSIVVCGSLAAIVGVPGIAHYAAAKGALAAMMRTVAVEYGRDGIRANMVCPGSIYTAMYGGTPPEDLPQQRTIAERQPIPRWGWPADVEGIAAYLMSDASSFHTGDMIVIDGGASITRI